MKRYNVIGRAAAIAALILAVFLTACDNPMEPDSGTFSGTDTAPALEAGKASVSFSINTGTARTVVPEIITEGLTYSLTGKFGGAVKLNDKSILGSGTTLALEPGEWKFTLNAFNGEDFVFTSGEITKTIVAAGPNHVPFYMRPLKEGTGAININFTYPAITAEISKVIVHGENDNGDSIDDTDDTLASQNGTWRYEAVEVPAGDYFTTFSFYRVGESEPVVVVWEIIQVRQKLTSKKTINISLAELKGVVNVQGADFAAKLQAIADNVAANPEKNNFTYLVEVTDNDFITPTILDYSGKTVSITLTGGAVERIISLSATGNMFDIKSGVTLALDNNITLSGLADNTASLVKVSNGGTLVFNTGAKITGNTAASGGGVDVNDGNFIMNGGKISGNTGGVNVYGSSGVFTMNDGEISGNTRTGGLGGGVVVTFAAFTMNGGKITGNTASEGGGVNANNSSTFTMSGGEISENTASSMGGGVLVYGVFTMSGGKISGNTASQSGGGVDLRDDGAFTMNGGEISGNNASVYGGGVYVFSNDIHRGIFTMTDGKISGNTANRGGGVFVDERGDFTKTAGIIYGSGSGAPLANNASNGGHTVYWRNSVKPLYRDSTLDEGDSISTDNPAVGWELPPGSQPVTITAIPGVSVPVTGGVPAAAITETEQYTGTVSWAPAHTTFAAGTVYTATITLTAKADYIFSGVVGNPNFFTVAGASSVHSWYSGDPSVPVGAAVEAKFPATAGESSYDGTIYELTIDYEAKKYIPGGPASGIPSGTIYDKNDLNWDDEWEGDYQNNHWIEVGSVSNNKLIMNLPATVPDTILRDDGFGYFGDPEVDAEHSFELMYFEGDNMGDTMFYYAENAVTNHEVDEGMFMNLKHGWNFFVYKSESDTIEPAEGLEQLYEAGYRWYLMPRVSVPALPDELPDDWETLNLDGWDEWIRAIEDVLTLEDAVEFMRDPENNAALTDEGRDFWNELIVYYDIETEDQTPPAPVSSPVEANASIFNNAQIYRKEEFRPREALSENFDAVYPLYEFIPPKNDLGEVSGGKLSITLPDEPSSYTDLERDFPDGYTMSLNTAKIQFLVAVVPDGVEEGMRIWLYGWRGPITTRRIEFVYASEATSFQGTDWDGGKYNLILEQGWNSVILYGYGPVRQYISQPVPANAAWIYNMK